MGFRTVDLAHVPARLADQLAALRWLDREVPLDVEFIRRIRKEGFPSSSYFGIYAVEGDRLLGHAETLALRYRAGGRSFVVAGVADVLTHSSALGRGIARTMLREVHRRETALGRPAVFLWTRRSWSAHRLYERLGYRDVYSPGSATRKIPSGARPALSRGYRWRRASDTDLPILERLLAGATRDRDGFVPRWPGSFQLRHDVGWRSAGRHAILFRDGTPVGYALTAADPQCVTVDEVVVSEARHAGPILASLERDAAGRWLAFGSTTFVSDHAALLAAEGYAVEDGSHIVLMGRPLGRTTAAGRSALAAPAGAEWVCHRGDGF